MACHLQYRDSGFFVTHTGEVTIGEINEVNVKMQESEHFDDHRFQLIDLLEADFGKIAQSHSKMPGASDAVASLRNEEVRVALVTEDPTTIRFCEEYMDTATRMGSSWSFKIFSDKDTALKWAKGA